MSKAKTLKVHGEVTVAPSLVERKNKKGGTFYTTQLRYVDLATEEFGRLSAIFDIAEAVADNARVGAEFKAECVVDGDYTNIENIRFMN